MPKELRPRKRWLREKNLTNPLRIGKTMGGVPRFHRIRKEVIGEPIMDKYDPCGGIIMGTNLVKNDKIGRDTNANTKGF